jgi:hypothetical protein
MSLILGRAKKPNYNSVQLSEPDLVQDLFFIYNFYTTGLFCF